jgi:hypothetical protein
LYSGFSHDASNATPIFDCQPFVLEVKITLGGAFEMDAWADHNEYYGHLISSFRSSSLQSANMAYNSVQAAQAFYENADDDARDQLAAALYYRELETIARPKPLLDEGPSPDAYPIKTVGVYDRDQQDPSQGVSLRGGESPWRVCRRRVMEKRRVQHPFVTRMPRIFAKPAQAIQLEDDDDDAVASAPPPPPPGPLTEMRMNIPELRVKLGYTKPFEQQFNREYTFAKTFLEHGYSATDQDSMILTATDWTGYLGNYKGREVLFKGFPMVEDVAFIKHPNYWTKVQDHGKLVESGQSTGCRLPCYSTGAQTTGYVSRLSISAFWRRF